MSSKKVHLLLVITSLVLVFSILSATALTAKIGNSRMILRGELGETFERHIRVINDNPEAVNITLDVQGDLEKSVTLVEESFIIPANGEKFAEFTIKADKSGTTETKIIVKFIPQEGNAVALASNIIVITEGSSTNNNENSEESNNEEESENNNTGSFSITPNANTVKSDSSNDFKISPVVFLSASTFILLLVLIGLFVYSGKKQPKKQVKEAGRRNA